MKRRILFLVIGGVAVFACLTCVALSLIARSSPSYQATTTAQAAARATRAPPTRRIPTPTFASTPMAVELGEAEARGLVQVDVSGDGLTRIQIALESISTDPLEVTIIPGTIFEAQSAGTQNMVVRERRVALLSSRGSREILTVLAACANMRLGVPDEKDKLTIRRTPTSEDLIKLLNLPDFHKEIFRVQQFAIWTITDNPSRNTYVGIGAFGVGSGPNEEEIGRMRSLFEKAGIPIDKYQALR